jgi:hypothetical protein
VLFKKNLAMKERANTALTDLQRSAYAMSMLRSRLESRINFILNEKGGAKSESCQELARVLKLVKNGEVMLNDISEKIESARFLEEFIAILDGAAASVNEIKNDIEQLMPLAEAALQELHAALSKVSVDMPPELREEIEQAILAEVSAAIANDKEKNTAATIAVVANTPLKANGMEEEGEDSSMPPEENIPEQEGVPI